MLLSDAYCEALIKERHQLLPALVSFLIPEADIKVKHAVAGQAGVLEQLGRSRIWGEGCDMAETVQVSAIGVAKHLCNGDRSCLTNVPALSC